MENENETNTDIIDIHKLQEAARNANAYYREQHSFQRNAKLTRLVHAMFNASQFLTALMVELFHHLHHLIHRSLKSTDPTIPDLPEEKNPAFYVYAICMCISFICGFLWIFTKLLERTPCKTAIVCAIGAVLMLTGGIFAMRHAEIHINLNEVSDEDLLDHPIFIHNFVLCIISIFGMNLYIIQGWILFDSWRWLKQFESETTSDNKTQSSESSESSKSTSSEEYEDIKPVADLNNLPKSTKVTTNPEEEEVILYCCCLDCWNYIKQSVKPQPEHEFSVVHIL